MSDLLALRIGGRRFEGWTAVSVHRSIDSCTDEFELDLTEREPGDTTRWEIKCGQACEVLVGDEVVLTGWIDEHEPGFDAQSHGIRVAGRDKSADLVDCSAVHKPGSWANRTIEQIARELLEPFGLKVKVSGPVGKPFKKFALQQGETVFEAVARMARYRGLVPVGMVDGGLELIRPGEIKAGFSLTQGEAPVLAASGRYSARDRFSQYILKAQAAGSDQASGRATNQVRAEAADAGVTRYRPLLIIGDEQGDAGGLKERAAFEASVRAGKGSEIEIVCQGWRDPAGAVWKPNLVAPVKAPWIGVDAELLISSVDLRLSDQEGSIAVLTLAPPAAFTVEPPPAEAKVSEIRG